MSKQAFKRVRRSLKLDVCREPLPAHAWPGGYPLYYLTRDCAVLCPDSVNAEIDLVSAARKDQDAQWDVVATDVHWEGEALTCDHCNAQIDSAYGPVDAE